MGNALRSERVVRRADAFERAALSCCRRAPSVRGKTTIGWRLMKRAKRRGTLGGSLDVTLTSGLRVELPRQSRMAWQAAADARYDEAELRALEPYVRPGTAILDIGASLGLWSVQLGAIARRLGCVVHAFEPNPGNQPWLARNLELNDLADVVMVHEIGLGDRNATVSFGLSESGVGNGAVLAADDPSVERTVSLCTLDELVIPGPVSLIKMDVEGFEPAVLRGATRTLSAHRPVVFGEFSAGWLRHRSENVEDLLRLIGYRPMRMVGERSRWWRPPDEARLEEVDRPVDPSVDNLLLLPLSAP